MASLQDHLLAVLGKPEDPCFEALTLLSALAAKTRRIRCALFAAPVTFRNPALTAKMAATIDHVSGGRLELCLGAGWLEEEHRQYGLPFPSVGDRAAMLEEAVLVLKSLWTRPRSTFRGRFYSLDDAVCEPKPVQSPHPPLWIGGLGERRTLPIAAEHADGWHAPFVPLDLYERKAAALDRCCHEVGRDPREIRRAMHFYCATGETRREVDERVQGLMSVSNLSAETFRQRAVTGSPEECAEQLLRFVKLGVSDIYFNIHLAADEPAMESLATQVVPLVKREGATVLAGG